MIAANADRVEASPAVTLSTAGTSPEQASNNLQPSQPDYAGWRNLNAAAQPLESAALTVPAESNVVDTFTSVDNAHQYAH